MSKDDKNPQEKEQLKKAYKKPTIKTEELKEANAQGQGSGGTGKTCNGNTGGGRKDTAGAGCSVLLT